MTDAIDSAMLPRAVTTHCQRGVSLLTMQFRNAHSYPAEPRARKTRRNDPIQRVNYGLPDAQVLPMRGPTQGRATNQSP